MYFHQLIAESYGYVSDYIIMTSWVNLNKATNSDCKFELGYVLEGNQTKMKGVHVSVWISGIFNVNIHFWILDQF